MGLIVQVKQDIGCKDGGPRSLRSKHNFSVTKVIQTEDRQTRMCVSNLQGSKQVQNLDYGPHRAACVQHQGQNIGTGWIWGSFR